MYFAQTQSYYSIVLGVKTSGRGDLLYAILIYCSRSECTTPTRNCTSIVLWVKISERASSGASGPKLGSLRPLFRGTNVLYL